MYHKHHSEYQNIKRSMIVLSLSLILVYIVLYYAKGDLWKTTTDGIVKNVGDILISEIVDNDMNKNGNGLNDTKFNEPVNIHGNMVDEDTSVEDIVINVPKDELNNNLDESGNMNEGGNNDLLILSGTKSYYGELDFVKKLGISYQYALKDEKNIYYLNMGDYDYDFSDIARKLKGNLYVMNTEQELITNGMFGDKATYINIPEYKNQKVLILLEIDNRSWLLAIDYSIYYQVKPYLKTLFID